ncbi:DHS-like NAD/FAD-binding domain-containing protein [Ephemerocybe angulata]|uniref:DHS-like NAD/FAD-binding domain-containing protein n=1 Tax=Ephemerocybe angulata TaxID=980116 RepID=A0A8H6HXY3_9AGAR|nr:DHS-like NAD/FAD-binding domain-containing protein [Tulosesus angulatus]
MTVFLPLEEETPIPQTPPFLAEPADRNAGLAKVVQAVLKAKRIVVICGAGISVQAGIPDFRSTDGLFRTLKRDNPREALSSGKDLFDASVFNSEHTTSLFCQMMAQLSDVSQNAEPTAFHQLLRALDDRGRLLRVYTQNIDAIEQKCGLSFGVPDIGSKKSRGRKTKANKEDAAGDRNHEGQQPQASSSRLPTPTPETPRCIPLHGTLQRMHCQICSYSFPLQDYLPSLNAGQPPHCPECTNLEQTRAMVGKRPRGVGKLRPSVVLYNEAHNNGEGVGNVVQKDLIGSSKGKGRSGADFLLVVGTSLRIPGTKRMVREFAKAVRSRGAGSSIREEVSGSGSTTPNDSSRHSPSIDEDPPPAPMKAVYLNLDFPVGTREWEGVFDAWVQGDAQTFAEMLRDEIKKETQAKEMASERKRRREEEAAAAATAASEPSDMETEPIDLPPTPQATPKKRGATTSLKSTPSKRHKVPKSSRTAKKGANSVRGEDEDGRRKVKALPGAPPPPLPITPPPSSSRRRTEYTVLPVSPLSDASPPPLRQWKTPSLGYATLGPSRRYECERAQWAPYRSTYAPLNILTSSIRSTLEDDERECLPVEVGQYRYRGAG